MYKYIKQCNHSDDSFYFFINFHRCIDMARYVLDMQKDHKLSFIELVNNDNADTIGTALTLTDVNFVDERSVDPVAEPTIAREFAVTLQNSKYAADTVEVYWNKIALADVMAMPAEDFESWYDPDTWDDAASPALGLAAFQTAATRAFIDPTKAMENVVITRHFDSDLNKYFMDVALTSMVFKASASFAMPKQFSETVTTFELNGFIYSPIDPAAVVE